LELINGGNKNNREKEIAERTKKHLKENGKLKGENEGLQMQTGRR
jgi:hypothetical protein